MKVALVLGAGGLVGTAHHAGVLHALERELGFTHADADVVIGTSAGSAIGAYLRTGWTSEGLMGRTRDLVEAAPSPVASNPLRVARHAVGSAYVLARTAVRVPSLLSIPPTGLLRRAFPAGLVTIGEGLSILDRELPRRWPDAGLWLTAYDLVHRRRVVLERPAGAVSRPAGSRPSFVRDPGRLRPRARRGHRARRWWRLVLHEPRPGTRRRLRRGGLRRAAGRTTPSSRPRCRGARCAISRRAGSLGRWPPPVAAASGSWWSRRGLIRSGSTAST